jgi:hypothetical protein
MGTIGRALISAVLLASACETIPVHREALVPVPVVLPNNMCAAHGKVAYSNDKPGERMICEMQTHLGTHLQQCTCWDEGLLAEKKIDTQEAIQNLETSIQKCGNGSCGAGSVGR